mgnify:CR=1 FL=1
MKKGLTSSLKCDTILPVSERNKDMNNQYYVKDEDGLFRLFDVSHDGLQDAIEFANDIGSDVMREHDGLTESVWSVDEAGRHDLDEPSDGFNSDAEADADALESVYGPEDDGSSYVDDYNDGY